DQLVETSGHKVSAPMIYEWVTGVNLTALSKAEGKADGEKRGGAAWGSANVHLRHINAILTDYLGKSRKTTIAGRPVGKCYDVPKGFRVHRRRPKSITLLVEWQEGTLRP